MTARQAPLSTSDSYGESGASCGVFLIPRKRDKFTTPPDGNDKNMMCLDVVVVNWNTGAQLMDCLKSLQGANVDSAFRLSHCVVVDNASKDDSADHLEELPLPITLIKNRENKGFACACNQGAQAGESDFILFLNPDVRLFPDNLVKALNFLKQPNNASIGILGIQLVDGKGAVQRNTARFPTPRSVFFQMLGFDRTWPKRFPPMVRIDWDHQESKEVDHVQGAFFLVRRKVFDELRGFDGRFFLYYEDLDFSLRAKHAGWKTYYLASAQAFHQGGGTTYQIKARRLSYHFYSLTQYISKHFGFWAGIGILIAFVTIEFWTRFVWNLIHFSGTALANTILAYAIFATKIPSLIVELLRRENP